LGRLLEQLQQQFVEALRNLVVVASLVVHTWEDSMSWLHITSSEKGVIDSAITEIDLPSDRATAIVAAAFVEDHLTTLLHSRMARDARVIKEAFRAGGPLGDFGTKITLGYLTGAYSDAAFKELNTIQFIRNRFAHSLATNSFLVQQIRDRCVNLKLWQEIQIKIAVPSLKPKSTITVDIGRDVSTGEREIYLFDAPSPEESENPRIRYVATCRFFIAVFALSMNNPDFKFPEPLF
jgi:hypothetical protein